VRCVHARSKRAYFCLLRVIRATDESGPERGLTPGPFNPRVPVTGECVSRDARRCPLSKGERRSVAKPEARGPTLTADIRRISSAIESTSETASIRYLFMSCGRVNSRTRTASLHRWWVSVSRRGRRGMSSSSSTSQLNDRGIVAPISRRILGNSVSEENRCSSCSREFLCASPRGSRESLEVPCPYLASGIVARAG